MALLDLDLPDLEVPLEIIIDQERRRRERPSEGVPLYLPVPDYFPIPKDQRDDHPSSRGVLIIDPEDSDRGSGVVIEMSGQKYFS
ncbi:hypothetical protein COY27_01755 [Candidatus Woesearchaeota archaeon CG_4_10_14_0_2_um_filter_33_13]|nr:MAG: hypothetical protein COY27_01755 [Candidatus Woesearchaeota archaeon CG_4_10_14_0_2_um_filter_33_13]